jgi:hypothetical protein
MKKSHVINNQMMIFRRLEFLALMDQEKTLANGAKAQ